jgi:hypothetical protein
MIAPPGHFYIGLRILSAVPSPDIEPDTAVRAPATAAVLRAAAEVINVVEIEAMMSDIKIPSGPKPGAPVDATTGIESGGSAPTESIDGAEGTASADAVTRIAEDLAAGRIDGDQAVERIIAETMDSEMVERAPATLRTELAETLKNLIETDPHLRSLARGLGASSED